MRTVVSCVVIVCWSDADAFYRFVVDSKKSSFFSLLCVVIRFVGEYTGIYVCTCYVCALARGHIHSLNAYARTQAQALAQTHARKRTYTH